MFRHNVRHCWHISIVFNLRHKCHARGRCWTFPFSSLTWVSILVFESPLVLLVLASFLGLSFTSWAASAFSWTLSSVWSTLFLIFYLASTLHGFTTLTNYSASYSISSDPFLGHSPSFFMTLVPSEVVVKPYQKYLTKKSKKYQIILKFKNKKESCLYENWFRLNIIVPILWIKQILIYKDFK